jgi:hypothetical protein
MIMRGSLIVAAALLFSCTSDGRSPGAPQRGGMDSDPRSAVLKERFTSLVGKTCRASFISPAGERGADPWRNKGGIAVMPQRAADGEHTVRYLRKWGTEAFDNAYSIKSLDGYEDLGTVPVSFVAGNVMFDLPTGFTWTWVPKGDGVFEGRTRHPNGANARGEVRCDDTKLTAG